MQKRKKNTMDDEPEDEPELLIPPKPILHRRNSIATSVVIPTILSFKTANSKHSSCIFPHDRASSLSSVPPSLDFELLSLKSSVSYTSIKDLLPASAVNSPTSASAANGSGYEISIRNRLVKQAAWAYLQPHLSCSASSDQSLFRRLWSSFTSSAQNCFTSCLRFIKVNIISGFFDCILCSGK